jgi:hypothetical protein
MISCMTEFAREVIEGNWVSNYGLVTLECHEPEGGVGPWRVTGSWGTPETKKGLIDSGTFDPLTNVLEFTYTEFFKAFHADGELDHEGRAFAVDLYESVSVVSGSARFLLDDNERLAGIWSLADSRSGPWAMHRSGADSREIQTASFASVAGLWQSDFGEVTLDHSPVSDLRPVAVSGRWEGVAGRGEILEGSLDPTIGVLKFSYRDKTRDLNGTCSMILSKDGYTMAGVWQDAGSQGTWTMRRDGHKDN